METGGKVKKGAAGRKGGSPKKKPVSRSVKAELQFPVGRIGWFLKKGRYAQCVGTGAPVYLAVIPEYLAVEEFASQYVYCCKKLELDPEKVNVNGGAMALGHPLGATV